MVGSVLQLLALVPSPFALPGPIYHHDRRDHSGAPDDQNKLVSGFNVLTAVICHLEDI